MEILLTFKINFLPGTTLLLWKLLKKVTERSLSKLQWKFTTKMEPKQMKMENFPGFLTMNKLLMLQAQNFSPIVQLLSSIPTNPVKVAMILLMIQMMVNFRKFVDKKSMLYPVKSIFLNLCLKQSTPLVRWMVLKRLFNFWKRK